MALRSTSRTAGCRGLFLILFGFVFTLLVSLTPVLGTVVDYRSSWAEGFYD